MRTYVPAALVCCLSIYYTIRPEPEPSTTIDPGNRMATYLAKMEAQGQNVVIIDAESAAKIDSGSFDDDFGVSMPQAAVKVEMDSFFQTIKRRRKAAVSVGKNVSLPKASNDPPLYTDLSLIHI